MRRSCDGKTREKVRPFGGLVQGGSAPQRGLRPACPSHVCQADRDQHDTPEGGSDSLSQSLTSRREGEVYLSGWTGTNPLDMGPGHGVNTGDPGIHLGWWDCGGRHGVQAGVEIPPGRGSGDGWVLRRRSHRGDHRPSCANRTEQHDEGTDRSGRLTVGPHRSAMWSLHRRKCPTFVVQLLTQYVSEYPKSPARCAQVVRGHPGKMRTDALDPNTVVFFVVLSGRMPQEDLMPNLVRRVFPWIGLAGLAALVVTAAVIGSLTRSPSEQATRWRP